MKEELLIVGDGEFAGTAHRYFTYDSDLTLWHSARKRKVAQVQQQ
jgi:hypothetical protein